MGASSDEEEEKQSISALRVDRTTNIAWQR
jgi:hypothetical protein